MHVLLCVMLLAGCGRNDPKRTVPEADSNTPVDSSLSLLEQRRNFHTKLVRRSADAEPPEEPPSDLFRIVYYDAPVGKLAAYLSVAPSDRRRHPAIIWIHGGDCNNLAPLWEPGPRENDQSASAFRQAGIVTMYPSLRGGNGGPGQREGFLGEADDVISASEYLSRENYVDPRRIYLGGHSTGATLVLLVAASSDRFRAIFSFGPVGDVSGYGPEYLPFDVSDRRELELRAPINWLQWIRSPTFVFEGATPPSNIGSLRTMSQTPHPDFVRFLAVRGVNHFSILFPVTHLIAAKIVHDQGPTTEIDFTADELSGVAR